MRFLMTGAAGPIGGHLAKLLATNGYSRGEHTNYLLFVGTTRHWIPYRACEEVQIVG